MLHRVAVLVVVAIPACTPEPAERPVSTTDPASDTVAPTEPVDPTVPTDPTVPPVATVLDDAFRIDLSRIDVVLDVVPDASLDGHATLTFTMRPQQDRALFHFDPVLRDGTVVDALVGLTLDGEALDPADEADLRSIRFDGSSQDAYELQRDLAADAEHTLVVDWTLPGGYASTYPGWLTSTVDDTVGAGNEQLWPTINSPDELARHTIEVRIDDPREYLMIGSGTITSGTAGGIQVFDLDTEREISSYTVMVAAMPVADVAVEQFDVGPVPVTLVSTESPDVISQAVSDTRQVMGELEADFGPFPMPSMQILLIDWPTGMEYYGATTTGAGALQHELIHMYWGCSAVNRRWRDTWVDEAVNEWWAHQDRVPEVPGGLTTDIVSGRAEIEPGFDLRAYGVGAVIIGAMADRVGGDEAMVAFLADLRDRRAFVPYTTEDLTDDLVDATGDQGLRGDVERWLYTP